MVLELLKLLLKKFIDNFSVLKRIFSSTFLTMLIFLIMKRIQIIKTKERKQLYFKKTIENLTIINSMEPLDYVPAFFIPTFLTQAAYLELSKPLSVYFKREYLMIPFDSGLISLDWAVPHCRNINHSERLLIIIHGTSGGSETPYIRDIVQGYLHNYSVVVIHARGINDTPLFNPKLYHAGLVEDIRVAIDSIRKGHKFKYVFLMGLSMGANIAYKFLANERGFDNYIDGHLNISNFFHSIEALLMNSGSITEKMLLLSKKGYMSKHLNMLKANKDIDIEKALECVTIRDFDNETVTKMFGYYDCEEYYKNTASGSDLEKLKNIKTLILIAKDDPIVFLFPRDYNKISESDNLICLKTIYGGHVGWYQGLYPERWFVSKCYAFCEEIIRLKMNKKVFDN